ncbi:MAG: hypothetical protein KDD61_10010 [Bdellovibrionales bacterium]|nr:hypothetical protein [Bdellovibrionales bacterium]
MKWIFSFVFLISVSISSWAWVSASYQRGKSKACPTGSCVCDQGFISKTVCVEASKVINPKTSQPFAPSAYNTTYNDGQPWLEADFYSAANDALRQRRANPTAFYERATSALDKSERDAKAAERQLAELERRQAALVRTGAVKVTPEVAVAAVTGDARDLARVRQAVEASLRKAELVDAQLAESRKNVEALARVVDDNRATAAQAFSDASDVHGQAALAANREEADKKNKARLAKLRQAYKDEVHKSDIRKRIWDFNKKYDEIEDRLDEVKDFYDNTLLAVYMQAKLQKIEEQFCGAQKKCSVDPKAKDLFELDKVFNRQHTRPASSDEGAR